MTNNYTKKYYIAFISIVVLFTSWIIYYALPLKAFFIPLSVLLILKMEHPFSKERVKLFLLFLPISLYASSPSLNLLDFSYFTAFVFYLLLPFLFLIKPENTISIYNKILKILAIILLPGIILHTLALLNIITPPLITTYYTEAGRSYLIYPFYVQEFRQNIISGVKFSSIFDEPGYLGTLLALILVLNKIDIKQRKNIIFLLAGILSLSLAFFLIIGLYILITTQKQNVRNIVYFIVFIGITYLIFYQQINDYIIPRITFAEGWIQGDTRGGREGNLASFDYLKNQETAKLLWGNGNNSHNLALNLPYGIYNSTLARLIYNLGLVPFFLFICFILFSSKHSFNNKIFGFFFILSIYQRPQVFSFILIFLLVYNSIPITDDKKYTENC